MKLDIVDNIYQKQQIMSNTKEKIEKLQKKILRLQREYHTLDSPSISDEVYDSLVKELRHLEEEFPEIAKDTSSPLERIGGEPLDFFRKVKHRTRMTSLNDAFSFSEIEEWKNRIEKLSEKPVSFFCQLKLDGLSASLVYKNGILTRGATRGNGLVGEDVSQNVKMINTIPLKLEEGVPDHLEVRGEVVMLNKVFESLNKRYKKEGKPLLSNTRNAAAGSLRQLDPNLVKERRLSFYAWDLFLKEKDQNKLKIINHSDKHNYLRKIGFLTSPADVKAKNLDEVFSFLEKMEKLRDKLPVRTDGIVVSVDDLETRDSLGIVGKAPRHSVAYKYQAEKATTVLKEIKINVGRTGVLTPVAIFNPTPVDGSIVSRATLHNIDQIERLDIRIGDTIIMQKAGDIIPEVVDSIKDIRTGKEKIFKMPKNCPVCDSEVKQRASKDRKSVAYYCENKKCEAKNLRGLQHFVNIFEIYEIGPKIINRLKDEGVISDAADLFTLKKEDLESLERFGPKSAENIVNSIEKHKVVPFWRFIFALGIHQVGEQTAQDLANHFKKLEKLRKAKIEEIQLIPNIGPIVSENIFNYFKEEHNLNFIDKLLKNGVIILKEEEEKGDKLFNKIFVITGTLPNLSREEAKKKIISEGGRVISSVSSKTDFLLMGNNPGSKYKEAKKLNIKIINEKELLGLVGESV